GRLSLIVPIAKSLPLGITIQPLPLKRPTSCDVPSKLSESISRWIKFEGVAVIVEVAVTVDVMVEVGVAVVVPVALPVADGVSLGVELAVADGVFSSVAV